MLRFMLLGLILVSLCQNVLCYPTNRDQPGLGSVANISYLVSHNYTINISEQLATDTTFGFSHVHILRDLKITKYTLLDENDDETTAENEKTESNGFCYLTTQMLRYQSKGVTNFHSTADYQIVAVSQLGNILFSNGTVRRYFGQSNDIISIPFGIYDFWTTQLSDLGPASDTLLLLRQQKTLLIYSFQDNSCNDTNLNEVLKIIRIDENYNLAITIDTLYKLTYSNGSLQTQIIRKATSGEQYIDIAVSFDRSEIYLLTEKNIFSFKLSALGSQPLINYLLEMPEETEAIYTCGDTIFSVLEHKGRVYLTELEIQGTSVQLKKIHPNYDSIQKVLCLDGPFAAVSSGTHVFVMQYGVSSPKLEEELYFDDLYSIDGEDLIDIIKVDKPPSLNVFRANNFQLSQIKGQISPENCVFKPRQIICSFRSDGVFNVTTQIMGNCLAGNSKNSISCSKPVTFNVTVNDPGKAVRERSMNFQIFAWTIFAIVTLGIIMTGLYFRRKIGERLSKERAKFAAKMKNQSIKKRSNKIESDYMEEAQGSASDNASSKSPPELSKGKDGSA